MPKPGNSPNIKKPGQSHKSLVRQACQSPGSMNTAESSGQVMNADRLNSVPNRSSEGEAAIPTLGRAPFPGPPKT